MNESKIKPAPPLREIPEEGSQYIGVYFYKREGVLKYTLYREFVWDNDEVDFRYFQAGLCFPNTPEGRLGAELRAKQGILPPQPTQPEQGGQPQFQKHMARLEETFERWKNSGDDSINFYNSGMISALGGFFHKYRNHQTPTPGRFVPESEIEKLSIAVDGGYLSDLPFIIRDFLKAIDNEKGGQTS